MVAGYVYLILGAVAVTFLWSLTVLIKVIRRKRKDFTQLSAMISETEESLKVALENVKTIKETIEVLQNV